MKKYLGLVVVLLLYASAPFAQAALTDNIVAYWKFDETSGSSAADATGNGHTGTLTSASFTSSGKINYGMLTSTNGYSGFTALSDLHAAGDFTVAGWMKAGSTINQFTILLGAASGLGLNFYAGHLRFYDGPGDVVVANYTTTNDSTYHFYVMTRSGNTYTLYVDGSYDNSASNTDSYTFTPNAVNRAGSNSNVASFDEVGVWTRALSSTEVSTLYNSGTGCQYDFSTCGVSTVAPPYFWSFWW